MASRLEADQSSGNDGGGSRVTEPVERAGIVDLEARRAAK
jgi:hypothetical protein